MIKFVKSTTECKREIILREFWGILPPKKVMVATVAVTITETFVHVHVNCVKVKSNGLVKMFFPAQSLSLKNKVTCFVKSFCNFKTPLAVYDVV